MADEHRETQEQSIKARKHQLYDTAPVVETGSRRPFKEFLRDTPATPLSAGTRAALWAVGVVVALLLVAAMLKGHGGSKAKPAPTRKAAAIPAVSIGKTIV